MPKPKYSFIIPVYNRPEEVRELLESFLGLKEDIIFEIVIVEDGSQERCDTVINEFNSRLDIKYFFKENSGPGDSRNFGMQKAQSDYFIILDSDVLLHPDYLVKVDSFLNNNFVDCFGGPDGASDQFTGIQKAINYSMTSFLTTGGVRGSHSQNFQPRSFNMGLSRKAFQLSGGFGKIHPGEDPDLVFRLWEKGIKTAFISGAMVYHKRRINWSLFYKQVYKFGSVRPILNKWHPRYQRLGFWLPSIFFIGAIFSLFALTMGFPYFIYVYAFYFLLVVIDAMIKTKNLGVVFMSVYAVMMQFSAYGYGFFRSTILLALNPKTPENQLFPKLFFK